MRPGYTRIALGIIISIIILSTACSIGFIAGRSFSNGSFDPLAFIKEAVNGETSKHEKADETTDLDELFDPFWQAWDLVHKQYVNQPVDDVALMRGAIRGMMEGLDDEHSSYIDPDQLTAFTTQIEGEQYEGIGAWVDTTGDYLTIISPMVGSPAEKAGLKPGDKIIAIDGEDMTGIDGELVRQRVIGEKGTTVHLTVFRAGADTPLEFEVTRDSITASNVMSRMMDDNIAYIRLIAFGDDKTISDFRTALKNLLAEEPVGVILDLRYNGGGLLESAVKIASEFINQGVIVYEQYGDGKNLSFEAKTGGVATEIPLVVLINEGSASASEIVAGAIQDAGRGTVVGMKSYGKGSVQIWTNLKNNQGAVRVTVASWLTPNERSINKIGIAPDIQVEITETDAEAGNDTQLEKAVEILLDK
ncbi:MAG: S41 family peptidase [Anaerolineales bacterium]|nr:S41 family peptidase [Anaerolineales bacterium]